MATTMDSLGFMVMEQVDLRQRITAMEQRALLTTQEMNEKFTAQEMHDTDFDKLHRHIVKIEKDIVNLEEEVQKKDARIASLEKDIVNLKKEGEQTDARLARLEDEEIARIQNARGGTYTLSGKSEADQASAAVGSELLCISPGCEFLKHPDGQELEKFPNHCCLDTFESCAEDDTAEMPAGFTMQIDDANLEYCKSHNKYTTSISVTTLFPDSRNLPRALGPPERTCHCKCGCREPLPATNAVGRRLPTTQCHGCGCTICSYCVHLAISSIVACHECSRGGECK